MSIIDALKNIIKSNKILTNFYANYSNKSIGFNREKLFSYIKSNQTINEKEQKFFKNILNDIEYIENIEISKKINSVLGWIPYIKGKTNALIYNFFSQNYALRKNLLLRYSIIDQGSIVNQKICWIKPQTIIEIKEKDLFDIEGQFLVVELFHPFIKNNHGGHGGHLRFWGKYFDQSNNVSSTTHSMPLDFGLNFIKKEPLSRSYIKNQNLKKITNFYLQKKEEINNFRLEKYGFGVISDQSNNISSVWHLAPANSKAKKIENTNQIVWCPKDEYLDPYILIDNIETGVEDQKIEISLIKNNNIINSITIDHKGVFFKKISEIFGKVKDDYFIFANFLTHGHSYFNILYNMHDNIGDSVHSHDTNWTINKKNLFKNEVDTNGNTRKFFYVNKYKKDARHYLILNNEKVKNLDYINLTLRLLTDKNEEYLVQKKLYNDHPCSVILIEEEFNFIKDINFNNSILQLESYDYNINGSLIYKTSNAISVDHLTGG